jgi:hypothetical protein
VRGDSRGSGARRPTPPGAGWAGEAGGARGGAGAGGLAGEGGAGGGARAVAQRRQQYEACARVPGREEEEDAARKGEVAAENSREV